VFLKEIISEVCLMFALAVWTFERIRIRLSLLDFKPRRVSLFISFTTPCKLVMINGLVRAVTFNTFYPLNSTHTCHIILFPTVFTLWYSGIHISTTNCGDKTSNIESSIDKTPCFRATLSIPDINLDNDYVWLRRHFDYFWFGGQNCCGNH